MLNAPTIFLPQPHDWINKSRGGVLLIFLLLNIASEPLFAEEFASVQQSPLPAQTIEPKKDSVAPVPAKTDNSPAARAATVASNPRLVPEISRQSNPSSITQVSEQVKASTPVADIVKASSGAEKAEAKNTPSKNEAASDAGKETPPSDAVTVQPGQVKAEADNVTFTDPKPEAEPAPEKATPVLPPPVIAPVADISAAQDISVNGKPGVAKEIATLIISERHPYLVRSDFLNRQEDLNSLYKAVDYQLLWLGKPQSEKNLADALGLLEKASEHGLNAENYDVKTLREKSQASLALKAEAYKDLALYDTALSLAMLRFAHDLHYGRIDPHGIHFKLKLREKKELDLPMVLSQALEQGTVAQLPDFVEPKLKQYQKLKQALAHYRELAANTPSLKIPITASIRPGNKLAQADALRSFLLAVGDLAEPEATPKNGLVYSKDLVSAVKRFQLRHGMNADGVLGKGTEAALNVPLSQRVVQIELAMERLRWLPELGQGPTVIVNIPAFQLLAIDDIEEFKSPLVNMRVVVGKAMKNQTPILMAQMRFIDFMPYWNVPYKIIKDEILPRLAQNPYYLEKENMELVSKSGPIGLSDYSFAGLRQGTIGIRQRPGTKNALGRVKFIFPNQDDVYLHDTPSVSLFGQSRRDFSHGCVRVAEPGKLAEFVLKYQGGWGAEEIEKAMKNPKNQRVYLKKSIPVLFFYITSLYDQNDNLAFYSDIYGHDEALLKALKTTEDLSDQVLFTNKTESVQPQAAK